MPTTPPATLTKRSAAFMLLDLAHHTMAAAPPRTWTQSVNQPGSRKWISAVIDMAGRMLERPLPCKVATGRRVEVADAVRQVHHDMGVYGSWAHASHAQRLALRDLLRRNYAGLVPPTLLHSVLWPSAPFDPNEIAQLRRRSIREANQGTSGATVA